MFSEKPLINRFVSSKSALRPKEAEMSAPLWKPPPDQSSGGGEKASLFAPVFS